MIAEVVALLMFIGPDIKEHRIQPEGMAQCLRHKRIAERQFTPNVQYKCIRSKAELDTNIDGTQAIRKLILEYWSNFY